MRRALLLSAAIAVPIAVLAIDAPLNTLIEVDNYDTRVSPATSYLNKAMCADASSPQVTIEWNIPSANAGSYQLYATDYDPANTETANPDRGFCLTKDTAINTTQRFGGPIGNSIAATSAVQRATVSGVALSDAASGTQQACASDGSVIFVCAHWFSGPNGTGTRSGAAIGRFQVQLAAPNAPSQVTVGSGPESLIVSWTESSADHYIAYAQVLPDGSDTPVDGAPKFASKSVTGGGPVTISGLTNGQRYQVSVIAYSVGGNPSDAAIATEIGIPAPVDGFWQVYRASGGREQGGCGAGAAGPAALLAVAGLLGALRRRK